MSRWNWVSIGISMVVVTAVLTAGMASAGIPKKINYQGRLVASGTGAPLAGTHNVTFRIYSVPDGGPALWSEPKTVVADSSGVFSVLLGSDSPINISFDGSCWLEVEVGGAILLPRRELVSVVYAFRAMSADSVPALGAPGTINAAENPVDWTKLKNVPAGFADGVDDAGGTGDGYSLDAVDGSPTDVVYVDGEGRVGIRTTSPSEALDVTGSINLSDVLEIGGTSVLDTGVESIFVGKEAGKSNTSGFDNTFVGQAAGSANAGGFNNTFIGANAGKENVSAVQNTFVGAAAGMNNKTGSNCTFVGMGSGLSNNAGQENTFLGCFAGDFNKDASYNTFVGARSGQSNTDGGSNTFLGHEAGWKNETGSANTFVGKSAGESNTAGVNNVFVGSTAGIFNEEGKFNTFVGMSAGYSNISGEGNTFVGRTTGESSTSGSMNSYFGTGAGMNKKGGSENTFLGANAGYYNTNGDRNVFLGSGAGFNEEGSNNLYVANGPYPEDVLIYGDFSTGRLGLGTLDPERKLHIKGDGPRMLIESTSGNPEVNLMTQGDAWGDIWAIYKHVDDGDLHFFQGGDRVTFEGGTGCVAIGADDPQGYRLYVQGQAYATGGWQPSDLRLKTDLVAIDDALGKVVRLSGHSFRWRTEDYPDRGFPEGRHYGLVGQEVEQVLPEVVGRGPEGEKALAYSELIPVLVEAVKELKTESDELRAENQSLQQRLEALERADGR
jgi:hypothetical protein